MFANNQNQERQSEHLVQITDMLLVAGYFRARIPNLDPFDKILGGLAWLITTAQEDVSIEFSDEMTMGRKIALSERVVMALRHMECPYTLQPHQIQGLDYPNLFPVVQWLVKFAINIQAQLAESNQKQANLHYHCNVERILKKLNVDASQCHQPKRLYKNITTRKLSDPIRIFSTLLEFGDETAITSYQQFMKIQRQPVRSTVQFQGPVDLSRPSFNTQSSQQQDEEVEDALESIQAERIELETNEKVKGQKIAQIINSEDISAAKQEQDLYSYLETQKEEDALLMAKRLELENQQRMLVTLQKQIENKENQQKKLRMELVTMEEQLDVLHQEVTQAEDFQMKLELSIDTLDERAQTGRSSMTSEQVVAIEALINKRNQLKEEQQTFRETCNKEIAILEEQKQINFDEESQEWFEKIDKQYNETYSRFQAAKTLLAERNQQVAILQRNIEVHPSKTELAQYQRRFVELYDQINLKLEENRKLYNDYNALLEVKDLLNNQIDTLSSFQSGFTSALKKKSHREEFAKQVRDAIQQVEDNANRAESKLSEAKKRSRDLELQLKKLEEREREYYQLVKAIQDETESY